MIAGSIGMTDDAPSTSLVPTIILAAVGPARPGYPHLPLIS